MTEEQRQVPRHIKDRFVEQAIVAVMACVVFALVGGLASLFTSAGWSGTWCLYGAVAGLAVAYFVWTTMVLAGASYSEDDLVRELEAQTRDNVGLQMMLMGWRRFSHDAVLQEAADAYVSRCREACREAIGQAYDWANKTVPDGASPEEREVDYNELRVRLAAYHHAYCVYQEACHLVEMLGFNKVERAELLTPYRAVTDIQQTFMESRLGPDAP